MTATTFGDGRNTAAFSGITGTGDNDTLLTIDDVTQQDTFTLLSTGGVFDVEGTLDGTNWSGPVSMSDLGGTSTAPVLVSVAAHIMGIAGSFKGLRVLQNGATNVTNLRVLAKRSAS